ncbi:hypothetical protein [Helicobacter rodentium]|uniref:hypothetical protein n=1 Tax=Helicobacter rodentium TaxID=59617 RepID=UPI0025A5540C|nr:hypothetical protein [Helicobacter rodentium]
MLHYRLPRKFFKFSRNDRGGRNDAVANILFDIFLQWQKLLPYTCTFKWLCILLCRDS